MKKSLLATFVSLLAASSATAQDCSIEFEGFMGVPLATPVSFLSGWDSTPQAGLDTPIIDNSATFLDIEALRLRANSVKTATRDVPMGATGNYVLNLDVECDDGVEGSFRLDCNGGGAASILQIIGANGSTVLTNSQTNDSVTVPGTTFSLTYMVDVGANYSLSVNGTLLVIAGAWPTIACDTSPTITMQVEQAPNPITSASLYFDNFCWGLENSIGTNYCMANVNSTGVTAEISAVGSTGAVLNDVELRVQNLPPLGFVFMITSMTQGFVANPAGSQGNLCVSSSVGRYFPPMNSGVQGMVALQLDLANTPQPGGAVAIMAGETWNFQAWYRDLGGNNNFSDGLEITFQ